MPEKKDVSPKVAQKDKIKEKLSIKERFILTEKQQNILNTALENKTKCLYVDGIWGSGKTYVCVLAALKLLNDKKIDSIIYIRNPVEASTTGKIGYLKGEILQKMEPYNAVFYDKLSELLSETDITKLKNENRIECIPLGFVRGRSWNCKAIIVDEASSMTWDDILLLMSRCGEFTRIFFLGDSLNSNDIGSKSGFGRMINLFNDLESKDNGVYVFELKDSVDIVRSQFLRFVMFKTNILKK